MERAGGFRARADVDFSDSAAAAFAERVGVYARRARVFRVRLKFARAGEGFFRRARADGGFAQLDGSAR